MMSVLFAPRQLSAASLRSASRVSSQRSRTAIALSPTPPPPETMLPITPRCLVAAAARPDHLVR